MNKALLVVDVQSYFLKDSPEDLPDRIAVQINEGNYDAVLFTLFKGKRGSNFERSLHFSSCLEETDLEIPASLLPFVHEENKFIKNSYSVFSGSDVQNYLQENDISLLEICGLDLEACVLATAFAAFDLGYDTKVLFDLTHTRFTSPERIEELINRNIQTKNG